VQCARSIQRRSQRRICGRSAMKNRPAMQKQSPGKAFARFGDDGDGPRCVIRPTRDTFRDRHSMFRSGPILNRCKQIVVATLLRQRFSEKTQPSYFRHDSTLDSPSAVGHECNVQEKTSYMPARRSSFSAVRPTAARASRKAPVNDLS